MPDADLDRAALVAALNDGLRLGEAAVRDAQRCLQEGRENEARLYAADAKSVLREVNRIINDLGWGGYCPTEETPRTSDR